MLCLIPTNEKEPFVDMETMRTWGNVTISSARESKVELDKMCTTDFRKLDFKIF